MVNKSNTLQPEKMEFASNISHHSNIPKTADNVVGMAYLIFGLCSLFGNSILLYISYQKKQMLKPAEYFIVNLALSDLGMTVVLYPLAITSSFAHRWIYGANVCLFYAFCGVLFGICSLSTVTLLSIVCCIKVCFPTYGNRFGHKHGSILICCAWAYSALFATSPLIHWGKYGTEPYGTACCIDWRSSNVNQVAMSYTIALFVFCFLIPCGIIITSFTMILITMKGSRKAVERHSSVPARMNSVQTIIVKLSIAVCIGFFTAWSPYAIIAMWAAFGSIDIIPPLAFAVPAIFAKSSTMYNPLIYLLLKPNFRNMLAQRFSVFHKLCAVQWLCRKPTSVCHHVSLPELFHKLFYRRRSNCQKIKTSKEGCQYFPCDECKDTFECFKHYPRCCHDVLTVLPYTTQANNNASEMKPLDLKHGDKKSLRVSVRGQKRADADSFDISLEVIPECSTCIY
ncbi:opsin-5-like [Pyxicephalus adspersus]|uniref:opsin-5-like n=1 Tax=Pyxicephalus adspersus TaxID=30357 RepID=UPI003B5C0B2D